MNRESKRVTLAWNICCLWRPTSLSTDLSCPSNSGLSRCNVSTNSISQIPSRLTAILIVQTFEKGSGYSPSPVMNKGWEELRYNLNEGLYSTAVLPMIICSSPSVLVKVCRISSSSNDLLQRLLSTCVTSVTRPRLTAARSFSTGGITKIDIWSC